MTIADRGAGIPDEEISKIFDPYFTTKPAASGLGLAISYSIVKRHGGLLASGNDISGWINLRVLSAGGGRTGRCRGGRRKRSRRTNPNHPRVLVMDDEAAIRELTSQLLGTLGYQVTAVADGLEAIKTYERELAPRRNISRR